MECFHSFLRLFCTTLVRVPGFKEPGWVPGSWERNPKLTPLTAVSVVHDEVGFEKISDLWNTVIPNGANYFLVFIFSAFTVFPSHRCRMSRFFFTN
jgi:hypothetical protein